MSALNDWNLSSCKTRTYLFYMTNIMGADVPWWRKEPSNQQPWCRPSETGIIRHPHVQG